ncbi:MAG: alpha/beta hydrolase [Acidimicrobiales bacterium]
MSAPILPGRLGTPGMSLRTDPRADPRMVAVMEPIGLADLPPPAPVDASSSIEEILPWVTEAEAGFSTLFDALADPSPVPGVARTVEVIRGIDGNDITLFVHRPDSVHGPVPGLLHLHGGGMAQLEAASAAYTRLRDELAGTGMVVVGVEFRNAGGKLGPYPFPAGLTDCISALAWFDQRRAEFGVSTLVVAGESGGGNLSLATTLRAKRDGLLGAIDGVYGMCPYISGSYAAPPAELASLQENDGYFLDCRMMGALAKSYDPEGHHGTDPLAWPYHASVDELRGLPPHVISVNQLDPLRDEGLVYAHRLLEAGVSVVSRTVNGTCHAGDLIFSGPLADVHAATIRDIAGFCQSLSRSA